MSVWTMRLYVAYVYLALLAAKVRSRFHDYLEDHHGFERRLLFRLPQGRGSDRVYGVAMFVGNKRNALRLARGIRKKDSRGTIIAFGPFAKAFHRRILEDRLADIVILSDAEFVFPQLCRSGADRSMVPNLAYLQDNRIHISPRKVFSDLDSLPFAGRYFCDKRLTPIPVVTARGCSFRCSFCDRPTLWGGRLRTRSVGNVFAEIDFLVRRYKVGQFAFEDADFLADKERAQQLCQKLMQLPKRISWVCSARVDRADPGTFRLMRRAGCARVYFGVESGDARVLRSLGKRYGRRESVRAAQWAREAGLSVGIFLTVGNPGESAQSLKRTKELLKELYPFSELTVNPLVVLPGTGLYADLVRRGKVSEDDYFEKDALAFYDREAQLYRKDFAALERFFES